MILLYILFALTSSMILTALFASHIRENKRGDAFIGFFVLIFLAALAMVEWLIPAVIAGRNPVVWTPVLFLVIFGAILVVSAVLSVRSSGPLVWAGVRHSNKQDAEALTFDIILWVMMLIFGIMIMRNIGV